MTREVRNTIGAGQGVIAAFMPIRDWVKCTSIGLNSHFHCPDKCKYVVMPIMAYETRSIAVNPRVKTQISYNASLSSSMHSSAFDTN